MPAQLTVCYQDQPATQSTLYENKDYRLGRHQNCDVVLKHPSVSAEHATVGFDSQHHHWHLNDLNSTNGSQVSGQRVTKQALAPYELINLGDLTLCFESLTEQQIEAESRHQLWKSNVCRQLKSQLAPDNLVNTLQHYLASTVNMTGMQRGYVLLGDQLDQLNVLAVAGITSEQAKQKETFSGSVGALTKALNQLNPVVSMDIAFDAFLKTRNSIKIKGIRALAAIPLLGQNECVGIVYTDSQSSEKLFTDLDMDILLSLTEQISMTLQTIKLQQQLADLVDQVHITENTTSLLDQSLKAAIN